MYANLNGAFRREQRNVKDLYGVKDLWGGGERGLEYFRVNKDVEDFMGCR